MYLCSRNKIRDGIKVLLAKVNINLLKSKDPLAQLVEHNTFNVGVMGSSPMRVTSHIAGTLNEKRFHFAIFLISS